MHGPWMIGLRVRWWCCSFTCVQLLTGAEHMAYRVWSKQAVHCPNVTVTTYSTGLHNATSISLVQESQAQVLLPPVALLLFVAFITQHLRQPKCWFHLAFVTNSCCPCYLRWLRCCSRWAVFTATFSVYACSNLRASHAACGNINCTHSAAAGLGAFPVLWLGQDQACFGVHTLLLRTVWVKGCRLQELTAVLHSTLYRLYAGANSATGEDAAMWQHMAASYFIPGPSVREPDTKRFPD